MPRASPALAWKRAANKITTRAQRRIGEAHKFELIFNALPEEMEEPWQPPHDFLGGGGYGRVWHDLFRQAWRTRINSLAARAFATSE